MMLASVVGICGISKIPAYIFLCRLRTPVLYKDAVCVCVCIESEDRMSCPYMRVVGGGYGNAV